MSIEIQMTRGFVTTVDDEDGDLARSKWQPLFQSKTRVCARGGIRINGQDKTILLHRIILERMLSRSLVRGEEVDHIDGDSLNNRRSNLRLATRSQNNMNKRRYRNNRSGYKGVRWNKQCQKWQAEIRLNNKVKYLGRYNDPEQAYAAYCAAAVELFGEFARVE